MVTDLYTLLGLPPSGPLLLTKRWIICQFVTCMDRSPASSRFFSIQASVIFVFYLNLMEEIHKMGHSCLVGVLCNACRGE
jgi:hypothetical protein